ncbi:unnamed protein product [Camellia sinensis]
MSYGFQPIVSDTCLARGTKRKLKQCTLLQLNFCLQSKVNTHSSDSDHVGANVVQKCPDYILCDTIHKLDGFVDGDEKASIQCKSLLNSESILCSDGSVENLINGDVINHRVGLPSLLPKNEMTKYEMAETMDDIPGRVLETFIVGRKFSGDVELNHGKSITLLRDLDNIKDCNAIKAESAKSYPPSMIFLAMGYIHSVGSISDLQDNDLKEVLNVLSVSELREILCKLKKVNFTTSITSPLGFVLFEMNVCISDICSFEEHPVLPNAVLEKTGTCIQISSSAESLIWRAERLFFLNEEQDLSAFLLVDLGIVKYPNYNCIISNQIFSSRNDLLAYEEVAQIMDQSIDENNNELVLRCIELFGSRISNSSSRATQSSTSESLVTCFSCFSALWVYSKVVLLGVSFLECERRYNDAINLLKQLLINFMSYGRRGYWTLRLSIDLEHLGCLNESLSVAEDGLLDPWVRAGSRTALQRRVLRLGKPPRGETIELKDWDEEQVL